MIKLQYATYVVARWLVTTANGNLFSSYTVPFFAPSTCECVFVSKKHVADTASLRMVHNRISDKAVRVLDNVLCKR